MNFLCTFFSLYHKDIAPLLKSLTIQMTALFTTVTMTQQQEKKGKIRLQQVNAEIDQKKDKWLVLLWQRDGFLYYGWIEKVFVSPPTVSNNIKTSTPVRLSERRLSDCTNMKEDVFDLEHVRIVILEKFPSTVNYATFSVLFWFRNVKMRKRNIYLNGFSLKMLSVVSLNSDRKNVFY